MYKITEWTDPTGQWMCGGNYSAKTPQGKWWYPARMMNMDVVDYIKFIQSFGGSHFQYFPKEDVNSVSGDVLCFSFDKYADAHKFVLEINKRARKEGWE